MKSYKEVTKRWHSSFLFLLSDWSSVADPYHFDADADTDPAFHFDVDPDPDPTCHLDADPDPTFRFDEDPDPQHSIEGSGSSSGVAPLANVSGYGRPATLICSWVLLLFFWNVISFQVPDLVENFDEVSKNETATEDAKISDVTGGHRYIIFALFRSAADPWNFCTDPDP